MRPVRRVAEQERAIVIEPHGGAADVAGDHRAAEGDGPAGPLGMDRLEAVVEVDVVPVLEPAQNPIEQVPPVDRRAAGERQRCRARRKVDRELPLVDIDADPEDDPRHRGPLRGGFGEEPREFPVIEHQIVGPLDAGPEAGQVLHRLGHRDRDEQAELGNLGGLNRRPEQHGEQQTLARPVQPRATAPAPSRTLVLGYDHGAFRRARVGEIARDGLRGLDLSELVDDRTDPTRVHVVGGLSAIHRRLSRSLARRRRCSSSRARSRSTTSAGARLTNSRRASLVSTNAISSSAFWISLASRWRSAARSTTPARCTKTSCESTTAKAESRGRGPADLTVTTHRASALMSGAASAKAAAASAPADLTVTCSSTDGGTRLSLRMLRTAVTTPMIGAISRSARGSAFARDDVGYCATMIESPACGSRCQISSVMNGMNGCSSRSVVSRTSIRVTWVRARRAGSSS